MAATSASAGPPDFIGVGAQRSGTTWWFRLLLEHPAIKRSARKKKELHFFNRFCTRPMLDADVARYHSYFPPHGGTLTGEWTPRYMYDPWTPRLMRRAAPDAKLLVMLRDPVERFRSGVIHDTNFIPGAKPAHLAVDGYNRGRYGDQLERLWAHFDREQVLVLQYERCRDEPLEQYARTLRFLGLEAGFEPKGITTPRGRSTAPQKEPLWTDLVEELRAALEPDVRRLPELVPDLDLGLWPHFS